MPEKKALRFIRTTTFVCEICIRSSNDTIDCLRPSRKSEVLNLSIFVVNWEYACTHSRYVNLVCQ